MFLNAKAEIMSQRMLKKHLIYIKETIADRTIRVVKCGLNVQCANSGFTKTTFTCKKEQLF